jgi:DNA-directed RNA polymerase subunit RPC12/RpoP
MVELKIVDITNKRSLECPHCGFVIDIPPRTITMEKLRHMQEVKRYAEWRKKLGIGQGIGNVRVLLCPRCIRPTICTDQFSIKV